MWWFPNQLYCDKFSIFENSLIYINQPLKSKLQNLYKQVILNDYENEMKENNNKRKKRQNKVNKLLLKWLDIDLFTIKFMKYIGLLNDEEYSNACMAKDNNNIDSCIIRILCKPERITLHGTRSKYTSIVAEKEILDFREFNNVDIEKLLTNKKIKNKIKSQDLQSIHLFTGLKCTLISSMGGTKSRAKKTGFYAIDYFGYTFETIKEKVPYHSYSDGLSMANQKLGCINNDVFELINIDDISLIIDSKSVKFSEIDKDLLQECEDYGDESKQFEFCVRKGYIYKNQGYAIKKEQEIQKLRDLIGKRKFDRLIKEFDDDNNNNNNINNNNNDNSEESKISDNKNIKKKKNTKTKKLTTQRNEDSIASRLTLRTRGKKRSIHESYEDINNNNDNNNKLLKNTRTKNRNSNKLSKKNNKKTKNSNKLSKNKTRKNTNEKSVSLEEFKTMREAEPDLKRRRIIKNKNNNNNDDDDADDDDDDDDQIMTLANENSKDNDADDENDTDDDQNSKDINPVATMETQIV